MLNHPIADKSAPIYPPHATPNPALSTLSMAATLQNLLLHPLASQEPSKPSNPKPPSPDDPGVPDESIPDGPNPSPLEV